MITHSVKETRQQQKKSSGVGGLGMELDEL